MRLRDSDTRGRLRYLGRSPGVETHPRRDGDRGCPGVHVELGEEPGEVALHRARADEERIRNLAVGQSLNEVAEHVAFARRQIERGSGCLLSLSWLWCGAEQLRDDLVEREQSASLECRIELRNAECLPGGFPLSAREAGVPAAGACCRFRRGDAAPRHSASPPVDDRPAPHRSSPHLSAPTRLPQANALSRRSRDFRGSAQAPAPVLRLQARRGRDSSLRSRYPNHREWLDESRALLPIGRSRRGDRPVPTPQRQDAHRSARSRNVGSNDGFVSCNRSPSAKNADAAS